MIRPRGGSSKDFRRGFYAKGVKGVKGVMLYNYPPK
jgi:hypothetical protein